MADEPVSDAGLPWPEAYDALLPAMRQAWAVDGEIYLVRQLSGGLSGALVYIADMTTDRFRGQAILKLDRAHTEMWDEANEADRHQQALDAVPDFAEAHLPHLLHSLHHGGQTATLSTIAAGGLEYVQPWFDCPHDRQLNVARRASKELLEGWNRDYRIADGIRTPQDVLQKWLGYRLDPAEGRIYRFVTGECSLNSDEPSFIFEGRWYPNPLAFALGARTIPDHLRLRAVVGNQHCDMHGNNLLVNAMQSGEPQYYLIDLAMYEPDQYLFFDHMYLELSYLLRARETANWQRWDAILDCLGHAGQSQDTGGLHGDDLGLIQMAQAVRKAIPEWIGNHESHRLSNMESQFRLARVGAGLSWTNKLMPAASRQMAFLYAASNLKDYLAFHAVDWPRHGPAIALVEGGQAAALSDSSSSGTAAPAPSATADAADTPPSPVAQNSGATAASPPPARRAAGKWIAAALAVLIVAALGAGYWTRQLWTPVEHDTAADTTALAEPEKPSVVVLPFNSLPATEEDDMLAAGMTSAITAALSQVPDLDVISRLSAETYKGKTVDARTVAKDLKVGYVLNGTLKSENQKIRVSVELVDGATGRVAWNEKFEDERRDVFDLEDEIALKVLVFLQVKLTEGEQAVVRGEATNNLKAYLLFLRAQEDFRTYTKNGMLKVRNLTARIHKLDPDFRPAYVLEGASYIADARLGYAAAATSLRTAAKIFNDLAKRDSRITAAERAMILAAQSNIDQNEGRFDAAIKAGEEAVALAPNNADVLASYGIVLYYAGDFAKSIAMYKRAMRVHPVYPAWYSIFLSRSYTFDGKAEDAIAAAKDGIARSESDLVRALNRASLVFAYREAGRNADARKEADLIKKSLPDFSIDRYRALQPFKNEADSQRFDDAVRAAGLS